MREIVDIEPEFYERFFADLVKTAAKLIKKECAADLPDAKTWKKVRRIMGIFLDYLVNHVNSFRRWQVVCDATTNPPALRANNQIAFRVSIGMGMHSWNEIIFSEMITI